MEIYNAINLTDLFNIEGIVDDEISLWLMYQTNRMTQSGKKRGCVIRLANSECQFMSVQNVNPETVCYLVYARGRYYKKESLAEQAVSKIIIDVEQILLKEGIEGKLLKEWRENKDPVGVLPSPEKHMITEIHIHETNGFCVFYPIEKIQGIKYRFKLDDEWSKQYGDADEWQRNVLVCYNSNKKQLNKAYIEEIFGSILVTKEYDYKQFFIDTLLDEQMCLNQDRSMELYTNLENNVKKYYIHGSEKYDFTRDGKTESRINDVFFIREDKWSETNVFFDGKITKIKGFKTEKLFDWWVKGELGNTRLKAGMIGALEQ